MSLGTLLLVALIGLLAGLAGGTLGIGGGIIIVPSLVFILGFTQVKAQGTSLTMMVPPVALLAAWNYYKEGHVDLKIALILIITFIIGGYFGSKIAIDLPGKMLRKIFGVFMLIVAIKMIFSK